VFNPYTSTCLTIVNKTSSWDAARDYCESAKSQLAVLPTLESIFWLKHMRKSYYGNWFCF